MADIDSGNKFVGADEAEYIRKLKLWFGIFDETSMKSLDIKPFTMIMRDLPENEKKVSSSEQIILIQNKPNWWKVLCETLDIGLVLEDEPLRSVLQILINLCDSKCIFNEFNLV